ncbi:MAG: NADH-quinone oxidoreductase subunit H [Candidatus Thermoplasmatota archaeon]|nr:NADH-quinone oxidoreductase subunit H [Candidatus Thermoplasmatota archaeon]MBU1940547.1 NADH-quinone oxidoreductase subunit H [Candidatus Thermoplasmatota archaeon]
MDYLIEVSETLFRVVIGTLLVALFGIIFGLMYKGVDRKIAAHMQGRIGPPLRQPFRDVRKLFVKENIVPNNAIPWLFNLIPLIGLVATISILMYLPLAGFSPILSYGGDLILILYLLIIPSLAMVLGGFASGSPYATVGAQREMATMIAYEFPLAIIIVSLAWKLTQLGATNVFALSTIIGTPIWNNVTGPLGFIGFGILLLVLILVTPAELSKIPFDSPEAETEIAGGLLVEYSGRNLAMFYLTDGVKTVVMASLVVALFFPYNLSSFLGLETYLGYAVDIIFYLVKVLLVIVFSVTLIRVAIARLKIDQVVYTYWIPLTLMSLVGLILVMWDGWVMNILGLA